MLTPFWLVSIGYNVAILKSTYSSKLAIPSILKIIMMWAVGRNRNRKAIWSGLIPSFGVGISGRCEVTTGAAEGVALVGGEADVALGNSSRPGEEKLALHIHVSRAFSFHRNVKYTSSRSQPHKIRLRESFGGWCQNIITYQPSHDKSYGCSYHTGGKSQPTLF